ncbi:MAG TPA: hypothetical protein VG944_18730, partial [Fimbriimonas sp.]|nr:hypothetical protein [Fimbriimonas sp.]
RRAGALEGKEFAKSIEALAPKDREERIWEEVTRGNVPDFLRRLVPLEISEQIEGRTVTAQLFVTPDYLAVGSNQDYFFTPLTPYTAQRIGDRLRCFLPTRKVVDAIYRSAAVKLSPSPIPPSPAMTTVPVFETHNQTVWSQRSPLLAQFPLGTLVAGDKKDIVICKALAKTPGHVAIYGWHRLDGNPIQPLYLGHVASWADYSHGVRLVAGIALVDGKRISVARLLADPKLSVLLSDEGPILRPRYTIREFPTEPKKLATPGLLAVLGADR